MDASHGIDRPLPHDRREALALARFEAIAGYLALDPPRGRRRRVLEQLASRRWNGPDGEPLRTSVETLRVWIRRYRKGGLGALCDKVRPPRGTRALSPEVVERACALKRQVPERSLERVIAIMETLGDVERGSVSRSTLHRALKGRGLSRAVPRVPASTDLDRFEADHPNDLWQSDMLVGPWLPDPEQPGKVRRAYMYAFLDDHSRLVLDARFSFKGDLPALELVLRRAIEKHGVPRRVYYDNGLVYHSRQMQQIVATLGMQRAVFTQPYRPQGHGKIEAFNRYVRGAFLSELRASPIRTLDDLNTAFRAWLDLECNVRVHAETGTTPLARWRTGIERVRYAPEELVRQAFLWRERRRTDNSGVFSLLGRRYQAGPELARRRIEVRYDPEDLFELEVWLDGAFRERARPLDVWAERRPRPSAPAAATDDAQPGQASSLDGGADWLGHLAERHGDVRGFVPTPRAVGEQAQARRDEADQAVLALLRERLDPGAFDEQLASDALARFGPFEPERTARVLDRMGADGGAMDLHTSVYLDAIRHDHGGLR